MTTGETIDQFGKISIKFLKTPRKRHFYLQTLEQLADMITQDAKAVPLAKRRIRKRLEKFRRMTLSQLP